MSSIIPTNSEIFLHHCDPKMSLPFEVIKHVLCPFLPIHDIIRITSVNKTYNIILYDESFWEYLMVRDFDGCGGVKVYKKCHACRIELIEMDGCQIWRPRVGNVVRIQLCGTYLRRAFVKQSTGTLAEVEFEDQISHIEFRNNRWGEVDGPALLSVTTCNYPFTHIPHRIITKTSCEGTGWLQCINYLNSFF